MIEKSTSSSHNCVRKPSTAGLKSSKAALKHRCTSSRFAFIAVLVLLQIDKHMKQKASPESFGGGNYTHKNSMVTLYRLALPNLVRRTTF